MTEKIKATWYTLGSPYDQSNRDQTRRMMCAVEKARAEHQVNIDVEFSRYAPLMAWRPCLELKAHKTFYLHYTNLSDFCGAIVSIRRPMRENAIAERKKIMATKKCDAPKANAEPKIVETPRKPINKKELGKLICQFKCALFEAKNTWACIGEEFALRGLSKGKEKIWKTLAEFDTKALAFLEEKGFKNKKY